MDPFASPICAMDWRLASKVRALTEAAAHFAMGLMWAARAGELVGEWKEPRKRAAIATAVPRVTHATTACVTAALDVDRAWLAIEHLGFAEDRRS
jgi:hypothetical protein